MKSWFELLLSATLGAGAGVAVYHGFNIQYYNIKRGSLVDTFIKDALNAGWMTEDEALSIRPPGAPVKMQLECLRDWLQTQIDANNMAPVAWLCNLVLAMLIIGI